MIDATLTDVHRQPRGKLALTAIAIGLLLLFTGFIALGTWQLYRLSWKLDLIDRVTTRIHAPATEAPAAAEWLRISAAEYEYRHVSLDGQYLHGKDTRIQAVTALGPGFWILTPFVRRDGSVVLVNRGFIRAEWHAPIPDAAAEHVVGLLRITEPAGGFLRKNDPVAHRWYSRDVAAIAAAHHLDNVAPYFIDAEPIDAQPAATDTEWPRAGLTVTHFNNNHLGYALTWFALAAMVLWGAWRIAHEEQRRRRRCEKIRRD